jgi:hypothetical protein
MSMMMRARTGRTGATILPLAAALLFAGCKDENTARRAEIDRLIRKATADLAAATAMSVDPGDASFEKLRGELERVVSALSPVRDGVDGQQAAAALITASAQRELAAMTLDEAAVIERANRRLRGQLHGHLDAATRLDALARGLESRSYDGHVATLDAQRASADGALREYGSRLADLDDPIAERIRLNDQDAAEARRLEGEATALRRAAAEAGPADGLARVNESIALQREADRFEYQIANREIDLDYELRPEHELASTRMAHLSSLLDEMSAAARALTEREKVTDGELSATRELLNTHGKALVQRLADMRRESAETLAPLYDKAAEHLEQAVTAASRAVSKSDRGEADAARLTTAAIQQLTASAALARARGIEEDLTILDRLAAARTAIDSAGNVAGEVDQARAARAAALDQARAALEAARTSLGEVKGGDDLTAFRQSIEGEIARLTGAPAIDVSGGAAPEGEAAATSTDGGRGAAPSSGAFASPEEALAVMQSVTPTNLAPLDRIFSAVSASTPHARRMLAYQREMIPASRELVDAILGTFSGPETTGFAAGFGATSGVTNLSGAAILDQTEDTATIDISSESAPEAVIVLRKRDEGWLIDGQSLFASVDEEAGRQLIAAGLPAKFRALAGRVRGGEFATAQEAMMAIMADLGAIAPPGAGG